MRLISQDGNQIGIVVTEEALRMAREVELDLVEVAPNARPPVCKIMDFNKLQYDKKRKMKESKKKARQIQLKEVKFRPTIDPHDIETKIKQVRLFLDRGDKVKLTLMFRGRQIVHQELGRKILEKVIRDVADVGQPEGTIQQQGRFMGVSLVGKAVVSTPTKARSHAAEEE